MKDEFQRCLDSARHELLRARRDSALEWAVLALDALAAERAAERANTRMVQAFQSIGAERVAEPVSYVHWGMHA